VAQIQELNAAIRQAPAGSDLKRHGLLSLTDLSDSAIECGIKAVSYFNAARNTRHTLATLAELRLVAQDLIRTLIAELPDRIGTFDSGGGLIEWKVKKLHDVVHMVCTTL
jgi:hypothetical protein